MSENNGHAALTIDAVKTSPSVSMLTARLGDRVLLVDKLDLAKQKHRIDFAEKVIGVAPAVDRSEVDQLLIDLAATQPTKDETPQAGPRREELLEKMDPMTKEQARTMLDDPLLARRVLDDIAALGVAGEKELSLAIYLTGVSRLLPRPLAGIVQGPSSSGKSFTMEKTASLFPPESVILATQMTPQALFYMKPGSLSHRFVVAGERSRLEDDDTAEATRALREMLGSGRLSKLIPIKVDGQMETRLIEQEGPIAYIESTTLTKIFDEDLNRCILWTTDEREQQTEKIIQVIADRYAHDGAARNTAAIVDRHHAMQRMIEPRTVLIPFAPDLARYFPADRVEARRSFPHLLGMIQASALLHQRQRQWDNGGYILADRNDYHLARRLMAGSLGRQLGGGLSDPVRRFLEKLKPIFGDRHFTTTEAIKAVKASDRSIRGWLVNLAEAGLAKVIEARKGPKPATWQLTRSDIPEVNVLPETKILFPEWPCRVADKA